MLISSQLISERRYQIRALLKAELSQTDNALSTINRGLSVAKGSKAIDLSKLKSIVLNAGGRNTKALLAPVNGILSGRDRNAGHPAPLAQIPACATNALGSYLRY